MTVAPTTRAPMLYPAPRADADAAATRLLVRDGALLLRTAQQEQVLVPAGALKGVHLVHRRTQAAGLRARHVPCVLLQVHGATALALPLVDWLPEQLLATADAAPDVDVLAVGGVRALVTALGRDDAFSFDAGSEDAGPLELPHGVRALRAEPGRTLTLGRLALLGRVLALVATGAWVAHGIVRTVLDDTARPTLPWLPVAVVVVAAVLLLVAAVVLTRPRPDGDTTVQAVAFAGGGGMARDDAGDLLLRTPDGRRCWLPGPAAGGVVRAVALDGGGEVPLLVQLADAGGAVLGEVAGGALTADEAVALERLLLSARVRWIVRRAPRGAPVVPAPTRRDAALGEVALVAGVLAAGGLLASLAGGWTVLALGALLALATAVLLPRRRRS